MAWIPTAAWILAAVVAIVVLGYCVYEITWKAKRLRRDVAELTAAGEQLQTLQRQLNDVRQRLTARESA